MLLSFEIPILHFLSSRCLIISVIITCICWNFCNADSVLVLDLRVYTVFILFQSILTMFWVVLFLVFLLDFRKSYFNLIYRFLSYLLTAFVLKNSCLYCTIAQYEHFISKFWSKNSAKKFSLPKKKKRKWIQHGSQSFYNLVLEVTLPHFCQILCIRSESASLIHTQGKGITQRHRHQENHLRICLPQCISSVLTSPFYRLSLRGCHFCKACPGDTRRRNKTSTKSI